MRLSSFDKLAAGAYAVLGAEAALGWSPRASLCPFRALTGLPCPGCGMGHALVFGLQGRWGASFAAHPLGLPLLATWTAYLAWGSLNLAGGRDFSARWPTLPRPSQWALLGLVLLVYAGRFL